MLIVPEPPLQERGLLSLQLRWKYSQEFNPLTRKIKTGLSPGSAKERRSVVSPFGGSFY